MTFYHFQIILKMSDQFFFKLNFIMITLEVELNSYNLFTQLIVSLTHKDGNILD